MNWRVKHHIGRMVLGVMFAQSLFFHSHWGRTSGPVTTAVALLGLSVLVTVLLGRSCAYLLRARSRHGWANVAYIAFFALIGIALTFSFALKAAPSSLHGLPMGDPSAGTPFLDFPARVPLQRWVQCCDGVLLGFFLMLLVEWRGRSVVPTGVVRETPRRFGALYYALPMLGVSLAMVLIFRPAIMTSDSMDQWAQATAGQYSDWHPFYHTLAIHALRKVWDSPTFVALFQASALAFACGWLISAVQQATQAPRWSGWIAAVLCAVCPLLALTSVTLWKDTPYAAAIIALTAAAISLVYRGTPDPGKPWGFLGILALAVVAMLLRHNAPPSVVATLVVLAMLLPGRRRALAGLGTLAIIAFVALLGPIRHALDVQHMDAKFALAAHHIAAHLAVGERPTGAEAAALLKRIDPTDDDWRYNCATVDPTIFNRAFDGALASHRSSELIAIWLDLAAKHPLTELRHIACVGSLVWSANGAPRPDGHLYISSEGIWNDGGTIRWVAANTNGLAPDSALPGVAQRLGRYLVDHQSDILWRPGLYLFVLLLAAMVAVRRTGSLSMACVSLTPVLTHAAVLALLNVAQDARYQLPVYGACLALAPCFLMARRQSRSEVAGIDR
jgi:hypothetical protein